MKEFYTGVGSRSTPAEVLQAIKSMAAVLSGKGWYLRSGAAAGADTAFEDGAKAVGGHGEIYRAHHANEAAMQMAAEVHPAWHRCSDFAKRLHARNCFQVLGRNLDTPSRFLVCWTLDGASSEEQCSITTGGTGTAIRLADRNGIPVFNLRNVETETVLKYAESLV